MKSYQRCHSHSIILEKCRRKFSKIYERNGREDLIWQIWNNNMKQIEHLRGRTCPGDPRDVLWASPARSYKMFVLLQTQWPKATGQALPVLFKHCVVCSPAVDDFDDIFVTKFGGSPNWVMILLTNLVTNLFIRKIWWYFWWWILWRN